jgi:hypothetical protein
MPIITRSTPGGTTSISRVDLSRSGLSSGSGGSAGSMEAKEGQDRIRGGEGVSHPIPIIGRKDKEEGGWDISVRDVIRCVGSI